MWRKFLTSHFVRWILPPFGEQVYATPDRTRANVPETSEEEQAHFFDDISKCGIKTAILSLIAPHNAAIVPEIRSLSKPLTELFNYENLENDFQELLQKSKNAFDELTLSAEEAENIEESTRGQSNSKVWFEQRAGRVTASKFKAACSTNPEKPSESLRKTICYPSSHRFSNAAT